MLTRALQVLVLLEALSALLLVAFLWKRPSRVTSDGLDGDLAATMDAEEAEDDEGGGAFGCRSTSRQGDGGREAAAPQRLALDPRELLEETVYVGDPGWSPECPHQVDYSDCEETDPPSDLFGDETVTATGYRRAVLWSSSVSGTG